MATTTPGHAEAPGRSRSYRAFVFDMDGVVTDTASVHAAAWKALFDEVLEKVGGPDQTPFDPIKDYREYVDGRTREDGIRSFLASRGIRLPEGSRDDRPDQLTVHGLAARKQQLFNEELARTGVIVFPDAVKLLADLKSRNIPTALVTASRNSQAVLNAAGLTDMFTIRVDGNDAARLSLPGKPDPAMFLEAIRRVRVPPADAVVLEDSVAGVQAAASGGFGLVVGVDRIGHGAALAGSGADLVVEDLCELESALFDGSQTAPGGTGIWGGGADT
jgi:beta-phosphoglucomutase family hydrolase